MSPLRSLRFLLSVCALLLVGAVSAQSYQWRDVVQKVNILPGGSVIVDDTRTLWTDDDFGEAFICVHLAPGQRLTLLEGSGALGPGPSATAFQQACDGGTEVVVKNSVRLSERRVRFVYRLDGALDLRSDVVQWYWQILEQDHPPVRGYSLTVTTPGPSAAPYDAYVHRFANPELPRVSLSDDRSRLDVAFDRVPSGDGVEIRYLMDPALFLDRGSRPGMESFLLAEAKDAGVQTMLQVRRSPWWAALPAALLGVTGLASLRDYRRVGREPRDESMKYPFEPPSDLPPAAVTSVLQQVANPAGLGPAFHATIMDLMRRGFGTFVTSTKKGEFAIELHDTDRSGLHQFESDVLGYLAKAARTGAPSRLSSAELKAYSQRYASAFMSSWGKGVRAWLEDRLGGSLLTADSVKVARKHGGRLLLVALASGVFAFVVTGPARGLVIALAGAALVAAIASKIALVAWRPEVAREVHGWQGFKRTLTDYTRMKDAPLDFFGLWDVYYCYAAALGVADQYLKTLKKAAPIAGADETAMMSRATWLSASSGGGFSNLGALSSSISTLSSALSSASASASSGGSSSGGGGGGGGGSSGGR